MHRYLTLQVTSGILEQKKRALGHSAALINELNSTVDRLLEQVVFKLPVEHCHLPPNGTT